MGQNDWTHDDMDEPPKVHMIAGAVQKSQPKESVIDAFVSAASAVAKDFSPSQTAARGRQSVPPSPGKKAWWKIWSSHVSYKSSWKMGF